MLDVDASCMDPVPMLRFQLWWKTRKLNIAVGFSRAGSIRNNF